MRVETSKEFEAINNSCAECCEALRQIIIKYDKFNAKNDTYTANSIYFTTTEILSEIRDMAERVDRIYFDIYEVNGMLSTQMKDAAINMMRATVVYYEILHEIHMLHNSTFAINVEYPSMFSSEKYKEVEGIASYGVDKYLKEKQDYVKKILENRDYIKIDFSLPKF